MESVSGWDVLTMTALVLAALLQALGQRRLSARGVPPARAAEAAAWIGWTSLLVSVAPPFDAAASRTFSSHMAQHELMLVVGVPLIVVSRPLTAWAAALPAKLRRPLLSGLQLRAPRRLWRVGTTPIVAFALHGLVMWAWHLPRAYEWAVRNDLVHGAQHGLFIGTGVLFWWGLVYGRYGRLAYGAAALYVFLTSVHTGLLGAAFALSSRAFYPLYVERARAGRIDPVADQQLAGLYMWIPAGIVLTLSGLGLILAWLAESDRRSRTTGLLGCLLVSVRCLHTQQP